MTTTSVNENLKEEVVNTLLNNLEKESRINYIMQNSLSNKSDKYTQKNKKINNRYTTIVNSKNRLIETFPLYSNFKENPSSKSEYESDFESDFESGYDYESKYEKDNYKKIHDEEKDKDEIKYDLIDDTLKELGVEKRLSLKEEYKYAFSKNNYFYAFNLLKNRINILEESQKKEELEDFFSDYKEFLKDAVSMDLLPKFSMCFANFINESNLSSDNKEYLLYVFPINAMSLCFSVLVGGNALNKASVFLPYINNHLSAYPKLINELIQHNRISALDYLLENTIHLEFNNYEIMDLLMRIPSHETIYYFFEKYNLNINSKLQVQDEFFTTIPLEWNTLFARIIKSKNFSLFENVLKNSKQKPSFTINVNKNNESSSFSILSIMLNDDNMIRYIDTALDCEYITNDEINAILTMIIVNGNLLTQVVETGIVKKLMFHQNLQNICFFKDTIHLFGFLSCVEYWSKDTVSLKIIKSLTHILECFFERFPDSNNIPTGKNVNLFSSTLYLMGKVDNLLVHNLLLIILNHYRMWINVENRCGQTPLELVPENKKNLKRILFNMGAVERKKKILKKLMFWNKQETSNIDFSQRNSLYEWKEPTSLNKQEIYTPLIKVNTDVEKEIKESFSSLNVLLEGTPLDVKISCKNIFLSAENILLLMKDEDKGKFNEDVFFLVQTFNDYLPNIIKTYIDSSRLENTKEKEEVLKQIEMLSSHVEKIYLNMELKIKKELNMDISRNTAFLKSRLGGESIEVKD